MTMTSSRSILTGSLIVAATAMIGPGAHAEPIGELTRLTRYALADDT